jgi:3-oxoacyl-[acyl-carrier-protein] synthase II
MLAGDVEESSPLVHALLDRFGALARAEAGLPEAPRPFDRRRNGFLLAEGATLLVLEDEPAANARGAPLRARLRLAASGFDASAPPTDWGDGAAALARVLRRALDRAGVARESIDVVVSGASGARRGDRLEALTLRAAWDGLALPPVLAPKAVCGEYGGGLLASALVALAGGAVSAPAGELDPELGVLPYAGPPLAPRRVLVTALAAGGAAAWAVLERP